MLKVSFKVAKHQHVQNERKDFLEMEIYRIVSIFK